MTKPLLIEIGVEELPAIPFLKELPNIKTKWNVILKKYKLENDFEFYYTPRRLVFWHKDFALKQADAIIEQMGAPIKIAYKDGVPTPAALGFAKKCGVDISEITSIDKGRGDVLYFKKEVEGTASKDLLNDMINEFIKSLSFGKTMRWGSRKDSFIRPIRSLCVMQGSEIVEAELFSVKSTNKAFPHRMVAYDAFTFSNPEEYFETLAKSGVILKQDDRKKLIISQMKEIEKANSLQIDIDEDLLEELVAINEYPTALLGTFDKEFLELPEEVIITSMKEHQRYFAVFNGNDLSNHFVVISNAKTEDFSFVIAGNEKVLRPRLDDGMFFYKNDLKNGLSTEALKKVLFVEGLGSVYDKVEREVKIADYLASLYNEDKELITKAVLMAKSDLMSEMVFEFTELQGLMGYYYAKANGEKEEVYMAIKEQYLPDGEDSELPSSVFSSIIALSSKIDSLMGLFSVGKIPTGSKDPFALRRAAAGIVKIAIEHKLELNFKDLINTLSVNYKNLDTKLLLEFFNDRLFKIFDINPSILKAVLGSGEKDIYKISKKLCALNPIVLADDFKNHVATFKRVANIIKDVDLSQELKINESLLSDSEEIELFKAYSSVVSKDYKSYDEELKALFALKPSLDEFFNNVFVNHEDENIKNNRKNLISLVYLAFRNIAD
ncbi:MAG: glycine--tRNA ligase subunit beta, partial [Campylobacteraceae bacterium]|nr:glycine--tRNA ligase subunit beta [Campylobacteraceae bacterium]